MTTEFVEEQIVDEPLCRIVPIPSEDGFFELRPYQQAAVESAFESWQDWRSTLSVLATGLGKTVIFAEIALRWPTDMGRVLVMAHREELIDQACEKLGMHLGENPSVEMGTRRELQNGHSVLDQTKVLVTSVQTMSRKNRMAKFNPMDFGLLVIDEAHHSPAETYRRVIEHFAQNPQLRILGVTATPNRADEAAMGDIFQDVSFEMDIRDGIDEGWLVPVEQKTVIVEGLDFSTCKTTAGDLNNGDLEKAMMGGDATAVDIASENPVDQELIQQQERMLHAVVSPTIAESKGRPTLIFGVTKAHAERLCEICRRHPGVTAEFVTDDTPKDERKEIFRQFRAGQVQILCGVGIFTEGFDSRADVISIARPTKSTALYIQMIGRGTRPLPGLVDPYALADDRREAIANSQKSCMTVLDFVGNCGRHSLISAVDILGGNYTEDVLQAAKLRLKYSTGAESIDEVLAEEAAKIEAKRLEEEERRRKFIQEETERKEKAKAAAEAERQRRQAEAARRDHIRGHATYRTKSISWDGNAEPEQVGVGMFRGGASDAQVGYLIALGVSEEKACSYSSHQACAVITKLKEQKSAGPCTEKQAKQLRKFGYNPSVTFAEARKIIDVLAANGWRRP